MVRRNGTLRHLLESRPTETVEICGPPQAPPQHRASAYRLSYGANASAVRPFSFSQLERAITSSALPTTAFFLDTCVVNGPETHAAVWNAMTRHDVYLTPGVFWELRKWCDDPWHNVPLHAHVRSTLAGEPSRVHLMDLTHWPSFVQPAAEYYIDLLTVRRYVGQVESGRFREEKGRDPTEDELRTRCQQIVGERGWQLTRKGINLQESHGRPADEEIVVLAVFNAILTGRESVILTRDKDVLEQFYKMIYLLDTHYRSCLIASAVDQHPWMFDSYGNVDASGLLEVVDEESLSLMGMPERFDERVLPASFHPVSVQCWWMGGESDCLQIARLSFLAEREMACVIRAKGATGRLNTTALDGLNCHRCFLPHCDEISPHLFLIGNDRNVSFGGVHLPIIDVNLSVYSTERVRRLIWRENAFQYGA